MARKKRQKYPEAIYHIMCHSVPEFLLFRDDSDKCYYLGLLKRYIDRFKCRIYAYCLMDNHLHIHLDTSGFDVSKFMHCTNTAYVRYYNTKYHRRGHVFQERFESRILDTDEYNLTVSAYIHNNPHDIAGYAGREENYEYSSYGIYLGVKKDKYHIIDTSFIQSLFNISNRKRFVESYHGFVNYQRNVECNRMVKEKLSNSIEYEYISGRKVILRDLEPARVISYILGRLKGEWSNSLPESKRKIYEFRAFTAYALRVLCGLGYKEICSIICNITISGCSKLFNRGFELLISENPLYSNLFGELLNNKPAA